MLGIILAIAFMFTGLAAFIGLAGPNTTIGAVVGILCFLIAGIFAWLAPHLDRY